MISVGTMIKQLGGLIGTEDLTPWEQDFVGNIVDTTLDGKVTATLSPRRVEVLELLWNQNFAG